MNQNEVITINLDGIRNTMAFLYVKDETNMEGVLYIVNNAKTLAEALWHISGKEGRLVSYKVQRQQLKTFKYKFLKHQGYKKLSKLTLDELNEKIYQHFGVDL